MSALRSCPPLFLGLLATLWAPACRRAAPAAAPAPAGATPGLPATGPIDGRRPLPSPLPGVAAYVNGKPIPIERVALAAREDQARAGNRYDPDPGALRRALQKLIVRELLFQEALTRRLAAATELVERAYDATRAQHLSENEWHRWLADQGLTDAAFRAELRVQATVDLLQGQVAGEVDPAAFGEEELRAYYEAHPELSPVQPARPFRQMIEVVREARVAQAAAERIQDLVRQLEARARIETFL